MNQNLLFRFRNIKFYRSCGRLNLMRRRSDFTSALDEMFCEDDKKRIVAIRLIKQIGATIGPIRVRNQLVPFLNQFLDDDASVMIALLEELENFTPMLGGSQYEKVLLPLLINFCLLDQKEVALKSLALMEQILSKHNDAYLDCVKKLAKPEMSVSKQCATILMANGIRRVPHLESTFLETYKSIVFSENPSFRIIAAKHLKKLTQNITNKEQICKIIDIFFNDSEDLPKLLVIDSLLFLYSSNPNYVLNKLKILICMGTWRINLKLCEFAEEFSKFLNRPHFKTLFQPTFLKMMTSEDNQIRAGSCSSLLAVSKNMSTDQNFSKLYPNIVKLSDDKIDFVKTQFAKNFVKIFPYFSPQKAKDSLIPIVIKCLKQSNLEVSTGVLSEFKELSRHLKSQKFQENILKPLAHQLSAQNWRLCSQTLDILGTIVVQQNVYTNFIVQTLLKQLKNKVQAVRLKASQIIINVIKNSPRDWCQSEMLPQLMRLKDQPNYLIRQRVIAIINETVDGMSVPWLANYRKIIAEMLVDKVPNIRMLALKTVYSKKKLLDKSCENLVSKMKEDNDMEIKQAARQIKI